MRSLSRYRRYSSYVKYRVITKRRSKGRSHHTSGPSLPTVELSTRAVGVSSSAQVSGAARCPHVLGLCGWPDSDGLWTQVLWGKAGTFEERCSFRAHGAGSRTKAPAWTEAGIFGLPVFWTPSRQILPVSDTQTSSGQVFWALPGVRDSHTQGSL